MLMVKVEIRVLCSINRGHTGTGIEAVAFTF